MKIAVIILNYNSSAYCRKCIGFLKSQKGVELEIIVVDNCSREDDRENIGELCKDQECTFIAHKENRGYSAGNNIGLRYAADNGYEYAVIVNPDMEFPQSECFKKLVDLMEKDKTIAVCSSDIITPDINGIHQNPQYCCGILEELFWPLQYLKNYKTKMYPVTDWRKSGYCEMLTGCFLMVRISFLKQVNFLDEKVFLYCEESILSKMVIRNGAKMYYFKDAIAIHHHINNEKGDPQKNLAILLKSKKYYFSNYCEYNKFLLSIVLVSGKIHNYFLCCFLRIRNNYRYK